MTLTTGTTTKTVKRTATKRRAFINHTVITTSIEPTHVPVHAEGLGAAQKGKNREGLSPEMRAINTVKLHFHMPMRDRGEMGKWG